MSRYNIYARQGEQHSFFLYIVDTEPDQPDPDRDNDFQTPRMQMPLISEKTSVPDDAHLLKTGDYEQVRDFYKQAHESKEYTPRQYSFVHFNYDDMPPNSIGQYPFKSGYLYMFLGEIPNMPGHCIVLDARKSRFFCGYHTEYFYEVGSDET